MDSQPKTRQEKKGDKKKRNKELHGKYNSKYTRSKISVTNPKNIVIANL